MNTLGISSLNATSVLPPFSTVGKIAVGLGNTESKEEALPLVEETNQTARALNPTEGDRELKQKQAEERAGQREERRVQAQEQQQISDLSARDREVRAHEQAHVSVGGQYTGGATFQYERGPDGVDYAIAGEVFISIPSGNEDPEQTVRVAEQVQRAALAPADPSAQDRRVAAKSGQVALDARAEIVVQKAEAEQIRKQTEAAELMAQQQQQDQQLEAEQEQERQQQLADQQQQASRKSAQFSAQFITLNNIGQGQPVGSVFDQRI